MSMGYIYQVHVSVFCSAGRRWRSGQNYNNALGVTTCRVIIMIAYIDYAVGKVLP